MSLKWVVKRKLIHTDDVLRDYVNSFVDNHNGHVREVTDSETITSVKRAVMIFLPSITTGTGKFRWDIPKDFSDITITSVDVSVTTAPTGSSIIIDINYNGESIFLTSSDKPEIATSSNHAVSRGIKTTVLEVENYITVDIDQADSNNVAENLTITITGTTSG